MLGFFKTLTFSITLLFCLNSVAEPLSWTATKEGKTYLLFGSVHLATSSMYPLPSKVTDFLKKSDGLIIEADVNDRSGLRYPSKPQKSQDYLTTQQLEQLDRIAQQIKVPQKSLRSATPWMSALTIQLQSYQQLGYFSEQGVDNYLIKMARSHDIPILTLESLQYQIDLFARYPQDGKEILLSTLEQFAHRKQDTHCLIKSWQTGDIDNLEALSNLNEISEFATQRFLIKRNQNWLKKLNSNTFINQPGHYVVAVGALHLVGEYGLPTLLEQHGFTVKPFTHGQKAGCSFSML